MPPTDPGPVGRAALSVDFELFRHTPAYRSAEGSLADRSVGLGATDFLLDVLDDHDARATFFVVGELAESRPETVARIADAGHEIASHTHTHRPLSTLDAADRREELDRSRDALESLTGRDVAGFRAPAFDLPDGTFAALDDAGYGYDSSVVPCRRIPGWYGGEYDTATPSPASAVDPSAPTTLAEVPVAVSPGLRLPVGGAWLRLLGRRHALWATRRLLAADAVPVLYLHPWELVDLPAVEGVPRRVTWRTGERARATVEALLDLPAEFVAVGELAAEAG